MPTINQLVRQGRKQPKNKSGAPALKILLKNVVCAPGYGLLPPRSQIQRSEKSPGFD